MKQILLGTSAIALAAAIASPATAAEWDLKWGGYMEQFVAFAASDVDGFSGDDFDGIDSKQDAEIHFKPSITLDNGLKFGVDIQLEGFQGGDQIDESYLFIKGSFGQVLLGSENSAGYKMTYAAPDVTFLNINSGSVTAFIPFSGTVEGGGPQVGDDVFRRTLGTTFIENEGNNDAQRFTYFTPRFAGFQLGVSYARDGQQDENAQLNCDAIACDYFDVGANYVNSFGDFNVALSGRWGIADNPMGKDPQIYSFGLNLGFAGVTIGGSFAEQNNAGLVDGQAYDAGISYETGPWGFSFTYFHGENADNEQPVASGFDEELDAFLLGASFDLAMGVKLNAFGAYVEFDEDVSDGGAGSGDDIDGFIIGTGIKISF